MVKCTGDNREMYRKVNNYVNIGGLFFFHYACISAVVVITNWFVSL